MVILIVTYSVLKGTRDDGSVFNVGLIPRYAEYLIKA